MRLSLSMQLEIRQSFDESDPLEDVRKMLSRPPQEVVELRGVGGVTPGPLKLSRAVITSSMMLGSRDILRIYVTKESIVSRMAA
jgi:hypothetical protein